MNKTSQFEPRACQKYQAINNLEIAHFVIVYFGQRILTACYKPIKAKRVLNLISACLFTKNALAIIVHVSKEIKLFIKFLGQKHLKSNKKHSFYDFEGWITISNEKKVLNK